MKNFIDGDQMVITRDNFVNLQESAAIFIPLSSELAKLVLSKGFSALVPVEAHEIDARLFRQDMIKAGVRQPSCYACAHAPLWYEGIGLCHIGVRLISGGDYSCDLFTEKAAGG